MPITAAMYESRERFMLDLIALTDGIETYRRENGFGGGGRGGGGRGRGGRGGRPPIDTPAGKLAAAARTVQQVYGALNGSGVRPGTLYPPTESQRAAVQTARALFEEVRGG